MHLEKYRIFKKPIHLRMYLAAPKTSFEINAEANCQEWEEFPL